MLTPIARGLALFLGGFTLLNFVAADANVWWIDFWPVPGRPLLIAVALVMLAYAAVPAAGGLRRVVAAILLGAAFVAAMGNAIRFYVVLAPGEISASLPIPLSLFFAPPLPTILTPPSRL